MKSYSTSTGCELRELEDLSEIPSDYRELGEVSDSESDIRGSVVSGTDLTSYSAMNLSDFQANRQSGAFSLVQSLEILCSHWKNPFALTDNNTSHAK